MKKITLLTLLFVCAIGFSQNMVSGLGDNNPVVYGPQTANHQSPISNVNGTPMGASTFGERNAVIYTPVSHSSESSPVAASSFGDRNAVVYQQELTKNSEASANNFGSILSGSHVESFADYMALGTNVSKTQSTASNKKTVVLDHGARGVVSTYTTLVDFQAACSGGTLIVENFDGGPGAITACGPIIDNTASACFPAGEIEDGFNITSTGTGTNLTVFIPNGAIGNTLDIVGSNSFADTTIVTFTGPDDVFAVAMDIFNFQDADTDYRIYDTGGTLIDMFTLNNPIAVDFFFGIISPDAIGRIEMEGLNGSGELFGSLKFGDCGGGGGGGAPCSQVNPSNGFENAFTTSSNTPQIIASDITVDADTDFTLETMTVNILATVGETITSADIIFYNDLAGVPDAGSVINSQLGVVPTSQSVIGNAFGFDVNELIFDITPELLAGQAAIPTTYWTSIYVTTSANGNGFIDSSTVGIPGNDQAFSPDAGVTWLVNGGWDSVYDLSGQCEPIGGGGGGSPCSEVNPTNGFENAFTTSSNTPQIIGTDITVAADTDFTLETMTVNILATVGETITSADIIFYNDLAGVPDAGSVINSQLGVVPTSQSVIGNAFGFDVNEVIFDITPELLAGQAAIPTSYWTSIYVTTSANGNGFIDSSTVGIMGFEQAFSPDAGVTWLTNGGWDTVYDFAGQCEPIGGGGGCTPDSLATTLAGGNGNFGNMFDINALTDLTIDSFDVHGEDGVTFDVEVWAKTGTWVGFENDPGAWTLIGTAPGIVSNGIGFDTPLNLDLGYAMATGETHAFYVTPIDPPSGGFRYTNGTTVGAVFASDANIEFLEGAGNAYPFGTTFSPRVFNGNILYCVGGGGGGPVCSEENPNDFTFENGLNCSSATAFQTANDVTVADGEDFEINQITASIFANGGIALVDVIYYDDAGGLPGAVIGSEAGIVPTSQVVIGSNFGLDVNEIVLDLTPFTFAGQNGSTTTYWTELSVTDGGGTGTVFCVVTSSSSVGNATALFNAGWGIFDPIFDGVYIWSGECTPLPPDPTYDTCDAARPIACGEIAAGSTIGATVDDVVAPTCDTTVTAPGVWYVYQDTTGLVTDITITMCNGTTDYDAKLSVYTGDCNAPPLTCVVGNDDTCGLQSEVSFQSDGATTFYILVHGFASNVGNFEIEMICTPVPPPNDMIANSIDVDEIGFPYTDPAVAMPAATTEAGTPADCDNAGVKGVWYNFVPTGDGDATASITTPGGGLMFTVNNGPLAGNYPAVAAAFGGDFTSTPITEDTAVVIDDNSGGGTDPNDACDPITNGGALSGKIAIIRRGECAFTGKVLAAQNEGAIAVIMVNNVPGDPIIMGGDEPLVTIPALMLSDVDGEAIIAEVSGGGTVNATMVLEPAAFSSVTFYTAPNENSVETDLTLVPWFENQCLPGIQATIPTVTGQAYYVYVSNPGAITDIVIDGTNLGVESNIIEGFTYYPNPTSSTLNLSSVESIENVEIYNMLGQKVIDQNVNATTSEISVSELSTGTYIMKVSVNGQIGTYKILKQ